MPKRDNDRHPSLLELFILSGDFSADCAFSYEHHPLYIDRAENFLRSLRKKIIIWICCLDTWLELFRL